MTAPLVDALRQRWPGLRLTVQTTLPPEWLAGRYGSGFDVVAQPHDFGLLMGSATEILLDATAERYRELHTVLDDVVAAEASRLDRLQIDLVVSNISYVALLAAKKAGIPAVAMSCLNWADIYRQYCGDRAEAAEIEAAMLEAYRSAAIFLCPQPSMPMDRLKNTRSIGPIARRGQANQAELRRLLRVGEATKVGLIAFGGVGSSLPFGRWPRLAGWHWVVAGDPDGHPDMTPRAAVEMGCTDLMWSCSVLIGKPGYGTFTEAAVNGIPVLYQPRPDWPENPYFAHWLENHGRCLPLKVSEMFDATALSNQLHLLFSLPGKPLPEPTGGEEAAEAISEVIMRTN